MNLKERKEKFDKIDIYPVTCSALSGDRSAVEFLHGVMAGGAKIIQLREKELADGEFYELASEFRKITHLKDVLFIINDRVDIALAVGADGVHLGQNDMPLTAARKIAPDILIGISTHNLDEALAAQNSGADYINIGPIFETTTKDSKPVGIEAIKIISREITIPFTVMGGIKLQNVDELLAVGARKIAVVTAITRDDDIIGTTMLFIRKIRELS